MEESTSRRRQQQQRKRGRVVPFPAYLGFLAALAFCVVLARARAFTLQQPLPSTGALRYGAAAMMPATARAGQSSSSISISQSLVSRKGGAGGGKGAAGGGGGRRGPVAEEEEEDGEAHVFRPRVVDVRNGYTSDGRRRLLSMAELFAEKQPGGAGDDVSGESDATAAGAGGGFGFARSGGSNGGGLFSRDGLFKLAGYAAVAYVGKQFFNGGRYDEAPDLSGKVAVVTGGNTGIGKETATRLAQLGAKVFIACRSPEKGATAASEITAAATAAASAEAPASSSSSRRTSRKPPSVEPVESLTLDLADLKTVEKFAAELGKRTDRVDLLINNAGVMAVTNLERTKEGFERHIGVNHLGHFFLTAMIWDLIKASPAARIINVSSEAHRFGGLDLEDLNYQSRKYEKWAAYGQSKLANILFTRELDKRLKEKGLDDKITTVCCHPGVVRTELGRYLVDDIPGFAKVALAPAAVLALYFTKSPKQGAQTQIYLAANPHLTDDVAGAAGGVASSEARVGGTYFSDCRPKRTTREAEDIAAADGLWALSEKLTGTTFNV